VSKPLLRWEFIVGKYLGMALTLSFLVVLFGLAMAGVLTLQGVGVSVAVIQAVILAWFEVLTVAAIAVFFSSFSSPFLSGIFALGLFTIGRLTPDIRDALKTADAPWIRTVCKVALEIVPDLHVFAVSGRAVDGQGVSVNGDFVSWGYVATAAGHGVGWIVALLLIAAVLFHRRDFV
jgi:ABC-type transport system involved in multi-copper enzyme maturation permease subunit